MRNRKAGIRVAAQDTSAGINAAMAGLVALAAVLSFLGG
jgi:hypothetical protein